MSTISPVFIAALHQLPSMSFGVLRRLVNSRPTDRPSTVDHWMALGADQKRASALVAETATMELDRVARQLVDHDVAVLLSTQPEYPALLKEIASPPPVLYIRGDQSVLSSTSLAVVGTRRPTPYGLAVTKRLVEPVARTGLTIVSGLAFGIDALAHAVAWQAGAPTIAVLGSGIDRIYPWEHRSLADDILAHRGAIISEFPLGAGPERHHFPQRNRVISGLAKAVLLVEAGEKSGALITAKFALDQNREVLAVPGPLTSPQSVGPHNWLKLGAKLVTGTDDILDVFAMRQTSFGRPSLPTSIEPSESAVLKILSAGPAHIDELAEKSRLDTSVVSATLAFLEIRGVVEHVGGMNYRLS